MLAYADDLRYRIYVAESIRNAAQGKYLTLSLMDVLEDQHKKDDRSAEEIAQDVIARHGLKIV